MGIQEHQGVENNKVTQDTAGPLELVDDSRRNFTKSGLVASGVLFTLSSQPVLGQVVCQSPSAMLSGNLSTQGTPVTCSGLTPGYWGTNTTTSHRWPSPYKTGSCTNPSHPLNYTSWSSQNATMFKDSNYGFHCGGFGKALSSYSMLQVILLTYGDPYQLGAHCVAALLNARKGLTPVLTEAQVRNIFNEYDAKGYFEPAAGVKWYPPDIVAYLKTTMK